MYSSARMVGTVCCAVPPIGLAVHTSSGIHALSFRVCPVSGKPIWHVLGTTMCFVSLSPFPLLPREHDMEMPASLYQIIVLCFALLCCWVWTAICPWF